MFEMNDDWNLNSIEAKPVGVASLYETLITTSVVIFRVPAIRRWCLLVTWLILPVVICLSQRLSHASLSISIYKAKLQMAH